MSLECLQNCPELHRRRNVFEKNWCLRYVLSLFTCPLSIKEVAFSRAGLYPANHNLKGLTKKSLFWHLNKLNSTNLGCSIFSPFSNRVLFGVACDGIFDADSKKKNPLWRHFEVAPPDCLRHFSRFFDTSKTLHARYLQLASIDAK